MENVVNYMEIWVEQFMDDILKDRPEVCTCEKCRQDIFALSLNNLQPFYVTTTKGEILAKYNVQDTLRNHFVDYSRTLQKSFIILSSPNI